MSSLTGKQISAIRDGDLTDFRVEGRDGPIGRLSSRTSEAGTGLLVVELGHMLFGQLVVLPLDAVREIDPDTETVLVNLSKREVLEAPSFGS